MERKFIRRARPLTREQVIKLYRIPDDGYANFNERLDTLTESEFKELIKKYPLLRFEKAVEDLINEYTLDGTTHDDFMEMLYKGKRISKEQIKYIEFENKSQVVNIKNNKKTIRFVKIEDYFPNILEKMPELKKEERYGRCHELCIDLSMYMTVAGLKHKVVSGFVTYLFYKVPYIHTWIEFEQDNGKVAVIDPTLGAVVDRDGYYRMKHPKQVCRISNEDIFKEYNIISDLSRMGEEGYFSKAYFMNRERTIAFYEEYFGVKLEPIDLKDVFEKKVDIYPRRIAKKNDDSTESSQTVPQDNPQAELQREN